MLPTLYYFPDFIAEDEEQRIMAEVHASQAKWVQVRTLHAHTSAQLHCSLQHTELLLPQPLLCLLCMHACMHYQIQLGGQISAKPTELSTTPCPQTSVCTVKELPVLVTPHHSCSAAPIISTSHPTFFCKQKCPLHCILCAAAVRQAAAKPRRHRAQQRPHPRTHATLAAAAMQPRAQPAAATVWGAAA